MQNGPEDLTAGNHLHVGPKMDFWEALDKKGDIRLRISSQGVPYLTEEVEARS